jgi:mono/diheme cytochrome c family protein
MKSAFVVLPLLLAAGCLLGDAGAGESDYNSACASCHGVISTNDTAYRAPAAQDTGGSGVGVPDLAVRVPLLSDERILKAMTEGVGAMPAVYASSDSQPADVLSYLRASFD